MLTDTCFCNFQIVLVTTFPSQIPPVKELRKLMRIQALRCHVIYSQNGSKLNVIPVLASRIQALRYTCRGFLFFKNFPALLASLLFFLLFPWHFILSNSCSQIHFMLSNSYFQIHIENVMYILVVNCSVHIMKCKSFQSIKAGQNIK